MEFSVAECVGAGLRPGKAERRGSHSFEYCQVSAVEEILTFRIPDPTCRLARLKKSAEQ